MDKKLTIDERIDEAYELYLHGIVPKKNDDVFFSDGARVGQWLGAYKYYLKNIGKHNPKAMELYEAWTFNRKKIYRENYNKTIQEFINLVIKYPEVLNFGSEIKLSTGRNANAWLIYNRKFLYNLYQHNDEYATQLVNVITQIDPNYFDRIGSLKNSIKNKMK